MASAYGWSKRSILEEVYYDELEHYMKRIRKDRVSDRLTELAMLHNPQSQKPKELFKSFQSQLQSIDGRDYLGKERMTPQDERKLREIAELMKSNANQRRNS